jgi:hypothetical protein
MRVLKLDRVGLEDYAYRSAFAIDLQLWELFGSRTIVEVAAILDRNRVKHTSDIALVRMLGEGKR